MAIAYNFISSGFQAVFVPSLTLSGITVPAGALLAIWMGNKGPNPVTYAVPTATHTGLGPFDVSSFALTAGAANGGCGWFLAQGGEEEATGDVTIASGDASNFSRWVYAIGYVTGHRTTAPKVQSKGNGNQSSALVVTLDSAPGSDSMVLSGFLSLQLQTAMTRDPNATLIAQEGPVASGRDFGLAQYETGAADGSVQASGMAFTNNTGLAIELAPAVLGGVSIMHWS